MSSTYFSTPNYKDTTKSVVGLADRLTHGAKELVVGKGGGALVGVARPAILGIMSKLTRGQLTLLEPSGKVHKFGSPALYSAEFPNPNKAAVPGVADSLEVTLRVVQDAFWLRMLLQSDLGFAESYMQGEVECSDLAGMFQLFILNRKNLDELSTGLAGYLFSGVNAVLNTRFVNSIGNAISNISAHYDISNKMFEAFLSPDMTYSCAIWSEQEGGLNGDLYPDQRAVAPAPGVDELEAAQVRKIRTLVERARLSKGDRVLEIGSGWGSFAIEAVRSSGCTVDTLTLSIEQKVLAEARIAAAGLSGSITVHLLDYRAVPAAWNHAFDRVVSCEMIEAVGREFLGQYWEVVGRMLKLDRGLAVVQVITMPEARFAAYGKSVDFIQKHIFPGGFLPSVTCLVDSVLEGTKGGLIIESIENIGPHYARTLREWQRRFEATFDADIVPALKEAYPELRNSPEGVQVFRRKWIYYFAYCDAGFRTRALGDHILAITREGNMSIVD